MTSLELSGAQVSLRLPYKQNKLQSHRYANERGKEQFSCVKERMVWQAESWKKSQEFEEEPSVTSGSGAMNQGGTGAGTMMGKEVQVLILETGDT